MASVVLSEALAFAQAVCPARQSSPAPAVSSVSYSDPIRVGADPAKGFSSPYFLFVPSGIARAAPALQHLLVVPNNSGFTSDDPQAFEKDALKVVCDPWRARAAQLGAGVLMPAFPRPADDVVYTHALSRATMTTTVSPLRRPDLQLIAMIDDAISREAAAGIRFDSRVLLSGFSAGGMFVNRFVFLHPDRVLAAAFGSPGGWAIAPVSEWNGADLPYPVGVSDLQHLTGKPFDLEAVAGVPLFLYLGDADTNDSVTYADSFYPGARKIVFDNFGATLQARWRYTEALYGKYLPRATLRLFPNVGHSFKAMYPGVAAFFAKVLGK